MMGRKEGRGPPPSGRKDQTRRRFPLLMRTDQAGRTPPPMAGGGKGTEIWSVHLLLKGFLVTP